MELTEMQKKDLRTVLTFMFGTEFANSIPMNEGALVATYEMLEQTKKCSKAMDYVPRPAGIRPGVGYLAKQLATMASRARNHDQVYALCKIQANSVWRREIMRAALKL